MAPAAYPVLRRRAARGLSIRSPQDAAADATEAAGADAGTGAVADGGGGGAAADANAGADGGATAPDAGAASPGIIQVPADAAAAPTAPADGQDNGQAATPSQDAPATSPAADTGAAAPVATDPPAQATEVANVPNVPDPQTQAPSPAAPGVTQVPEAQTLPPVAQVPATTEAPTTQAQSPTPTPQATENTAAPPVATAVPNQQPPVVNTPPPSTVILAPTPVSVPPVTVVQPDFTPLPSVPVINTDIPLVTSPVLVDPNVPNFPPQTELPPAAFPTIVAPFPAFPSQAAPSQQLPVIASPAPVFTQAPPLNTQVAPPLDIFTPPVDVAPPAVASPLPAAQPVFPNPAAAPTPVAVPSADTGVPVNDGFINPVNNLATIQIPVDTGVPERAQVDPTDFNGIIADATAIVDTTMLIPVATSTAEDGAEVTSFASITTQVPFTQDEVTVTFTRTSTINGQPTTFVETTNLPGPRLASLPADSPFRNVGLLAGIAGGFGGLLLLILLIAFILRRRRRQLDEEALDISVIYPEFQGDFRGPDHNPDHNGPDILDSLAARSMTSRQRTISMSSDPFAPSMVQMNPFEMPGQAVDPSVVGLARSDSVASKASRRMSTSSTSSGRSTASRKPVPDFIPNTLRRSTGSETASLYSLSSNEGVLPRTFNTQKDTDSNPFSDPPPQVPTLILPPPMPSNTGVGPKLMLTNVEGEDSRLSLSTIRSNSSAGTVKASKLNKQSLF